METTHKPVPCQSAKAIADAFDKDCVIIVSYDHASGQVHITTYGKTMNDKHTAANVGEICAAAVGADVSRKTWFEDFRKPRGHR